MNKPPVTLITPLWNGAAYLPDYLDSVLAQTLENFEFLLVDDGSDDDSRAIAAGYRERFRRRGIDFTLLTQPHAGQAAAMNTALAAVRGETIAWADADDLLHPDNLRAKYLWLQNHPDYGMVRCGAESWISGAPRETAVPLLSDAERQREELFEPLFEDTAYCYPGCYMVRSALFEECYPDRRIPVSPEGQNLQMLLPPVSRTRCGTIPEILLTYRCHDGSHSARPRSFTERKLRAEGFYQLRLALLPYCRVDRQFYRLRAEAIRQQNFRTLLYSCVRQIRQETAAAGKRECEP